MLRRFSADGVLQQNRGQSRHLLWSMGGLLLETHPHDQPHQEHLRHRAPQNREDKRLSVAQDGAGHGLQIDLERQAEMAEAGRVKPTCRNYRGSAVQGRDQANQIRRLKSPAQTFEHSSLFPLEYIVIN